MPPLTVPGTIPGLALMSLVLPGVAVGGSLLDKEHV